MSVGTRGRSRARVGLLVNPIAGLGGRVGLKGTDGEGVAARALELGAQPQATVRAAAALARLASSWPTERPRPKLLCGPAEMGWNAAEGAGWEASVMGQSASVTSAHDTRRLATAMAEAEVDVLVFAGGDGTARDIHMAVGEAQTVLGIPAGVKIQSAVFATSPGAAGELVAQHLSGAGRTVARELLDLDEEAYCQGRVQPRLHGVMRVPSGRLLQSRKAPTPAGDAAAGESVAAELVAQLEPGRRYVLGPGTTTRAVAERLDLHKTLVGVDGLLLDERGAHLVVDDASEEELLAFVTGGPAAIVLTPIGGQGFLFGRGNQPISPTVIRAVGLGNITVLATPTKLAQLAGHPLLVDTGDMALDQELSGYIQVITGRGERAVVRVEKA